MLKSMTMSRQLLLAVALAGGASILTGLLAYNQAGRAAEAAEREAALATRLDTARSLSLRLWEGGPVGSDVEALRLGSLDTTDLARVNRLETILSNPSSVDAERLEAAAPLLQSIAGDTQTALSTVREQRAESLSSAGTMLLAAILVPLAGLMLLAFLVQRAAIAPVRRAARQLADAAGVAGTQGEVAILTQTGEALSQLKTRIAAVEADAIRQGDARAEASREAESDARARADDAALVAETLEGALRRLAAGDLTCRIETALPERFAAIPAAFNAAAAHLHDTVAHVTASVASITNGTNEIGQAADDLSRRTEQQAASLDKTATALDEITATVKHSAENAASVASSVAAARLDTERSGEVMREAVAAMNAIQKSSQQIARIIGVIDEIAFQTNLLALNAGVEAARAGDAGRGFAVVALEVRALAQRSSEAAKEIKSLIGASSAHVGDGVDLVSRSGEVLTRIAAQVTQVDALVQEIAGSAREQSTGIAEVNEAVNKMDRVTQQNAAMVEETTAATLSLRTETEELCRLLASFQVSDTDRSVANLRQVSAAMHAAPPVARLPAAPAPRAPAVPVPVVVAAAGGSAAAMAAPAPAAAADDLGWEEF
ncbi:methyl-accepting chemotaxis protein [Aureimonas jatrophae]|uniref:Methyl-accepting chemotaxis protein n=1 Tax=Aureimonas jatrophae TaxID=1166073 RepID=A0A1H0CTY2_9HYPH|nr:methyl-accepting chemotaxis protein [Aureimonas jatrophae]MBB3951646.1 methyl-accepting chemotaxis protein [Aureimonas jatrophae]SDN61329.1 methyl-accepting chemotaxis protein [Aureimonas jatrophae]